jgi:phosphoribosylformylglycinamidine synthase subunit PurQ / glutaminase
MRAAVIVFPGSNCDRDGAVALTKLTGRETAMIWHQETELPPLDLIFLPGGFSYGDYLRCGAIAAQSPVMREVVAAANRGVAVMGVCNGFHLLTESGLLPGALIRNAGLKFVCRAVDLSVEQTDSLYTKTYAAEQTLRIPVAHGDGNYRADDETLAELNGEGRVAFRYINGSNPNGSADDIAGIYSESKRVLGMMPHPERAIEPMLCSADGWPMFESMLEQLG